VVLPARRRALGSDRLAAPPLAMSRRRETDDGLLGAMVFSDQPP
jgi:hypothetical protein